MGVEQRVAGRYVVEEYVHAVVGSKLVKHLGGEDVLELRPGQHAFELEDVGAERAGITNGRRFGDRYGLSPRTSTAVLGEPVDGLDPDEFGFANGAGAIPFIKPDGSGLVSLTRQGTPSHKHQPKPATKHTTTTRPPPKKKPAAYNPSVPKGS